MVGSLRNLAAPIVFGLVLLIGWELVVRLADIDEFLLPKPSSIAGALGDHWAGAEGATLATAPLRTAGTNTAVISVVGLVIGVALGAVMALVASRFVRVGDAVTPLFVALNATPIVALAPIFNAWFGLTSMWSNLAVVIVVVFFPVFINTAKGLTEVGDDQLELLASYGAPAREVLRKVRVPNALPFFLTSLRIAAPSSVIAAIVAEYFGGPQDRLGPVITQNASFARYDVAWAAIVVASAIGLVLFAAALAIEWRVTPWRRSGNTSPS